MWPARRDSARLPSLSFPVTEPTNSALPEHGHDPVLPGETLAFLDPQPGWTVIDCTLGRGGHSALIAERLGPHGRLIGLDVDPANLGHARNRLAGVSCRTDLIQANFSDLDRVLDELEIASVDAILADLGVSTNQLLGDTHGLSFSADPDQPLDMRLDPDLPDTAADLLRRWDEKRIADVLYYLAQERYSRRIARKIVEMRRQRPISTTGELADLVRSVVPRAKRHGKHAPPPIDPATRSFMALRMAVNRELDVLQTLLDRAPFRLVPGGRMVVISFHSGEDRLVKNAFRDRSHHASSEPRLELLTKKPVTAGEAELARNPRARSAKLRAARRVVEDSNS